MEPIHTPSLAKTLEGSNLLLDTCTIIEMLKSEEICKLIGDLTEPDCNLLSISPVKDELTYGANTTKEYSDVSKFLSTQKILILDETRRPYPENEVEILRIALSRCKKINPSYVDRVLLSIPYFYRKSSEKIFLATLNYKDVPLEFFQCVGMITYCTKGAFRNIGFYEFDQKQFKNMMKDVIGVLAKSK